VSVRVYTHGVAQETHERRDGGWHTNRAGTVDKDIQSKRLFYGPPQAPPDRAPASTLLTLHTFALTTEVARIYENVGNTAHIYTIQRPNINNEA
jgi:hypothetical protein